MLAPRFSVGDKTLNFTWSPVGTMQAAQLDPEKFGAEEGTRTPTPLRVRGPEPRASANSATSARALIQRVALNRQQL